VTDHGKCYECGQAAGQNPGCRTCIMWGRIIESARVNRRKYAIRQGKKRPTSARRPQRQPSPVVNVGDEQLPPSDR